MTAIVGWREKPAGKPLYQWFRVNLPLNPIIHGPWMARPSRTISGMPWDDRAKLRPKSPPWAPLQWPQRSDNSCQAGSWLAEGQRFTNIDILLGWSWCCFTGCWVAGYCLERRWVVQPFLWVHLNIMIFPFKIHEQLRFDRFLFLWGCFMSHVLLILRNHDNSIVWGPCWRSRKISWYRRKRRRMFYIHLHTSPKEIKQNIARML